MKAQKLKILKQTKTVSQSTDYKSVFFPNILRFETNDVPNYPKVSRLMSPPICHFIFLIFVLETVRFKK